MNFLGSLLQPIQALATSFGAETKPDSRGRRASHVIDCQNITDDAADVFDVLANPSDTECKIDDMYQLFLNLTVEDRKAAFDKICDYTGSGTDTSCGEGSGMDIISMMLEKYDGKTFTDGCMIDMGDGDTGTPEDFIQMSKNLLARCEAMTGTDDYCYLKAIALDADAEEDDGDASDDASPTKDQLDVMCDPVCASLAAGEMAGDESAPPLEMMCAKGTNGNYCILTLADTMGDDGLDADVLDEICLDPEDPCAPIMAAMMGMAMPIPMSPEDTMTTLCMKDENDYCSLQMAQTMTPEEEQDLMCGFCKDAILPFMMAMMGVPTPEQLPTDMDMDQYMASVKEQTEFLMQTTCFKDGDKYCSQLEPTAEEAQKDDDDGPPTMKVLQYQCGPCGQALYDARVAYFTGKDPNMAYYAAERQMNCAMDGENFCIRDPEARAAMDGSEDSFLGDVMAMSVTADATTPFCENPCVSKVLMPSLKMTEMSGVDIEGIVPMLNVGCIKDGADYCLVKTLESAAVGAVAEEMCPFEGTTCSAECKAAFNDVKAQWGCCASQVVSEKDLKWAADTCAIIVDACGGAGKIMFDVDVSNLKYSWFQPKMDDYESQIATDVSAVIDVLPGLVSLEDVAQAGASGSKLKLSASVVNAAQAAKVVAAVKAGARRAGLNVEFKSLDSSLPADAKVDPEVKMIGAVDTDTIKGEGSVVDAIAAVADTTTPSAAAQPTAFAGLVLLASIFATLANFSG